MLYYCGISKNFCVYLFDFIILLYSFDSPTADAPIHPLMQKDFFLT
jgi:hypothetical protein